MSESIGLFVSGVFFVLIGVVLGWYIVSVMGVIMVVTAFMR